MRSDRISVRNIGGRVTVDIDTPTLRACIIDGQVQRWDATPRQDIPNDFDAEAERRRIQQGGCCGAPSDA